MSAGCFGKTGKSWCIDSAIACIDVRSTSGSVRAPVDGPRTAAAIIAASLIRLEAKGDQVPRAACDRLGGVALQDCLLPDRRVEVLATTRRP